MRDRDRLTAAQADHHRIDRKLGAGADGRPPRSWLHGRRSTIMPECPTCPPA
jgi:hypothetical protein